MSDRARSQLDLARDILGLTRGRPRQIVLKRALSNAYYALFQRKPNIILRVGSLSEKSSGA